MSVKFSETEKRIRNLFSINKEFTFRGNKYKILTSGKPTPLQKGECKTDIYILSEDIYTKERKEFKISIKQSNADFLENKINIERANQLFGKNTSEVLTNSIKRIYSSFINDELILINKKGKTEGKTIKIGWKFELCNKKQGEKSDLIILSDEQKIEVYSGMNLSEEKKNSIVNNDIINNSGVSNYILVVDDAMSTENDLDKLINEIQPIKEYAIKQNLYFACKAINYRVEQDKWDGDRPLAVFVNWFILNNKINSQLNFENPLSTKANVIGNNIREILKRYKLNKNNFSNIITHLSKDIKYYI